MQCLHYLRVVHEMLKTGELQEHLGIPPTTTLGGMVHFAVQTPTIEFGTRDRPFTLDTSPLKSGPRKGQPRNEKIFHGEPSLARYIERCSDWYRGAGEYAHLLAERQALPIVDTSRTFFSDDFDSDAWVDYNHATRVFSNYSLLTKPVPNAFPRNPKSMITMGGKIDSYAPFYVRDPSLWPELIRQTPFATHFRDGEDPLPGIHQSPVPDPSSGQEEETQQEVPPEVPPSDDTGGA
jgi:hypothetical protein